MRLIISEYAENRVKADVAQMNFRERTKEIEKPLNVYRDKIDEWLFETYVESFSLATQNDIHLVGKALSLFNAEEFHGELCKAFLRNLTIGGGLLFDLFYLLKDYCTQHLRNNFPVEAQFILDNCDTSVLNGKTIAEGYYDELYGRSMRMIVQAMYSMGIDVPIAENTIIYSSVEVVAENVAIVKSTIYGDVTANFKK